MAKFESIDEMLLQTESGEWMDEYLQCSTIDQSSLLVLINSLRNMKLEVRDLLVSLSPIRTQHRIHSMDISKQPIFLSSLTSNLNIINAIKGDTNVNKQTKKRSGKLNMSSIASKIDIKENEEQFEKLFIANDDQMKISQMKKRLLSNDLQAEDVLLLEILLAYSNNKLSIIHIPIPSLDFDYISDPLSMNDDNIDDDIDIEITDKEQNQKRKKRREHLRVLDWNTKFICNYIEINDISSKYGHRTAIRAVIFSSDDLMIASVSKNELKIWNTRTFQCIRNFDCEYGLQCLFAPGNKHIIIATKQGNLLLYDLISNELIQKQIAHDGSIYALDAIPDQNGIISGGSDTCLKIWQFTLKIEMQTNTINANANGVKQLFLQLQTTVKLQDEILAIKYSNDQKYLAIALLDNTIQIYFADSMKFYLRLYGHKLPVTCVDISSDNSLLISGSADKNIKIWGLKFGDCLRSIFAHRETVMQVRFVPNTHYFYSCSRDKSIKYWDGDKFKKIQELRGHCQEVWCLALNSTGQLLLSSGGDRSLRLWLETSSLLFSLEEEQKEFESLLDKNETTVDDEQHPTAIKGSGLLSDGILQSRRASKKTMNIIERGERLIDDLQLADKEMKKRNEMQVENDNYSLHAKMYGYESIEEYMFEQIIAIPSSDLEEVLRIIPYEFLPSLFHYMQSFVNHGRNIEKITRCVLFLVKYHASQLKSHPDMHSILKRLKRDMKLRLKEYQNRIGFNLQAMFYMQNLMQTKAEYYMEADRYKHVKLSQKDIFQTWADEEDDENIIIVD